MNLNKLLIIASLLTLTGCSFNINGIFGSSTPVNTQNENLQLKLNDNEIYYGSWTTFEVLNNDGQKVENAEIVVKDDNDNVKVNKNQLVSLETGTVELYAKTESGVSNVVSLNIIDHEVDPYTNVTSANFYTNYKPATSYKDSYYRSLHSLMSGSIESQDQNETISKNQPKEDGKFVKNISYMMSNDNNIYYIYDSNGYICNRVFKGGAYVILEEVAAYLTAFNNVPKNYIEGKNGSPSSNAWGKYLRLNHSYFSGDTDRYPYEPELPNISGCGGNYKYYEVDIGTTGTTCDSSYSARVYNNGSSITRGAARIVYSRYVSSSTNIDIPLKYLFYTNNHYNDFREYLNYQNGWGEIFGNITGGGTISSKYDYNPTSYVPVVKKSF